MAQLEIEISAMTLLPLDERAKELRRQSARLLFLALGDPSISTLHKAIAKWVALHESIYGGGVDSV